MAQSLINKKIYCIFSIHNYYYLLVYLIFKHIKNRELYFNYWSTQINQGIKQHQSTGSGLSITEYGERQRQKNIQRLLALQAVLNCNSYSNNNTKDSRGDGCWEVKKKKKRVY